MKPNPLHKELTHRKHRRFRDAIDEAKAVAREHGISVPLVRDDDLWIVIVPLKIGAGLVNKERQDHEADEDVEVPYDDEAEAADDEYFREVVQPLTEEFADYQDSAARSEEEGWFYEH